MEYNRNGVDMSRRITDEQKKQMLELYSEIGTYAGVAREMGVSPSTASRYIKEGLANQKAKEAPKFDVDIERLKKIVEEYVPTYEALDTGLSQEEFDEMRKLVD